MPWLQVYYRNKRVLLYISSIKNTRVICIFYLSFIELSIQIFSQISLSDLLINTFQKWYRLLTKFTLYKILYSSIGKKLSTVQVKLYVSFLNPRLGERIFARWGRPKKDKIKVKVLINKRILIICSLKWQQAHSRTRNFDGATVST